MRCQKYREWVSLSLDGELPPDRAIPLEDHLEACTACRQYHDDLQLGRRLLQATRPVLSENFEWRLRLKLNQTLAEAARESVVPWRQGGGRQAWLRNFGLSGAVGLAAVVLFAFLFWPQGDLTAPALGPRLAGVETAPAATDRRPISSTWSPPDFGTRFVSSSGASASGATQAPRGLARWSGEDVGDLRLIIGLRDENLRLRTLLMASQREIQALQAQLDTAAVDPEDSGRR